ncbi:MAG TPA: XdhC family protein [Alphaproteobacteria bacterium]|nr:XdhC family protein [Alphaproteobacteria bacterium]
MWDQFLEKTSELLGQGASFAVATVVRVLPPTSGKPGDKAIIQSDGRLWGWIGGGCAQPVVIKEALKALADGASRLVRISPSPNPSEEGTVDYTMTCHSGGALDIYIEPVLPKTHVVILGRSPVARTLAQLASAIGYAVTVVADGEIEDVAEAELIQSREYSLERARVSASTLIVVSTQGEGDEEALEQALKSEASYIGFVASRTKARKVFDYLKAAGITDEKLNLVRAPAGLDIHARSPEEIAVSILAQLIQVRSEMKRPASVSRSAMSLPIVETEAKDPICGMTVNASGAKHKLEYEGKTFFFCCAGCRQAFEREPARYASG